MLSSELKEAFIKVLADYRPSADALSLLKKLRLVLLSGPSAAGRNSVIFELVKRGGYRYIVSDTTRPPRINDGVLEQDGREYWFRKPEELLADLKEGSFLEAELIHDRQVSGMSMRELKKTVDASDVAINEVEIGGFEHILKLKPDTLGIFLLPPDFDTWMKRLVGRGKMDQAELISRLKTGQRIFEEALSMPKVCRMVNDDVKAVADRIDLLVKGGPQPDYKQADLERLLNETKHYLAD